MLKKKSLWVVAAIVVIGALVYFFGINRSTGNDVSSMEVNTGSIKQTLDVSGKITSDDVQEIIVAAGADVLEVMVNEGDRVAKGDILAVLDTSELKTRLDKLRINLEQVEADLRISDGASDKQILQNNLQKANEELSNTQREYQITLANLEDIKVLYENGAVSQVELENQENALKNLESRVKTAELNVQDAKLRYSDLGSTTSSTAGSLERQKRSILLDIRQLENQIEDSKLIAELEGIVVSFELKANRTTGDSSKVIVQKTDRFLFEALASQEDAVNIEKGQEASVIVAGLTKPFQGQVVKIGNKAEIDSSSGSTTPKVKITIELSKVDDSLVSGYDADANIIIGRVEDVLLIKNETIKEDDEIGSYVFIVEGGKAIITPIKKGITNMYMTEVKEGLNQGDIVILNPEEELQGGSAVRIIE